jgi:hypothetical protein
MGSLIPGETYVYERVDNVTYARVAGSEPSTRVAIGWDYDTRRPGLGKFTHDKIKDAKLWNDIRETAKSNPALQKAIEQCIIIYNLSKDHGA